MWKFDEFWEIITLDLMRVDIGEISQNSLQEYLKAILERIKKEVRISLLKKF